MNEAYCGIGSRKTPQYILMEMMKIGAFFAKADYTLRSGAARGADSAFEKGCDDEGGQKEIFLPWRGFNHSISPLQSPSRRAYVIAEEHHPAWEACSGTARKLHARNSHQVLGQHLDDQVDFVVCWHTGTGGTTQACRIASAYGIKIYNLIDEEDRAELHKLFISTKERYNAQNQA